MASDLGFKAMNAMHHVALKLSGGKVGWKAGGMPVVELTTIGRSSGLPRTVMLTSPYQDGDTWIVVGSRGGDDIVPHWVRNLEANPKVEVSFGGGPKQSVTAHIATPDERARLWPVVTGKQKRYAGYQSKTSREIPLILLTKPT